MIRSKQTPWSPPNQTSPEKSRTHLHSYVGFLRQELNGHRVVSIGSLNRFSVNR
jgi:hypothetical protein